ncbi:MAG TPA: peptide ABC transporter substrate-binding protein [Clostridiales bacterium]|nr:peptide ABC transporter substrate-binding protein [Clostridiales bacterium]
MRWQHQCRNCSPAASDESNKAMKEYTTVYDTETTTLNYLVSSLSETREVVYNLVEGLVDFDKYGVMVPSIADSWEVSPDGLRYTFKLKEGIYWYTNTGEQYAEVTAQDFVDGVKYVLNVDNESTMSNIVYEVIRSGEPYYNKEITDFNEVGIKAPDKYTLVYTLEKPTPYFLRMLSYVCFLPVNGQFLEEAGDQFASTAETMLYNGAYVMETFEPQNVKVLTLNENFWDKDKMRISKITYRYNKEASSLAPELFLRREVTEADITLDIVESWLKDPEKKGFVQPKPSTTFSTYLGFNFDPLYEDEYKPNDWRTAVNNENFRKSFFHAFDKNAAILTVEPNNPENVLLGTIIPRNFVSVNGIDYTQLEPLKKFSSTSSYNEKLALEYKDKAMRELKGKVDFPITVVWPYNTSANDWAKRSQVVEQQLERTLGTDYIDVVIVPYPPSGFNSTVRSGGKYSIMEMTWGADYPDPATFTDVFVRSTDIGWSYNKAFMALDYLQDWKYTEVEKAKFDERGVDKDGVETLSKNEKYPQLKDKKATYDIMVEKAKDELLDLEKRYNLFAEAEAFLIDHAIVIPFFNSRGGYIASYCDPFSAYTTQFNRDAHKVKGKIILDKPMTPEEYKAAEERYNTEKVEALNQQ